MLHCVFVVVIIHMKRSRVALSKESVNEGERHGNRELQPAFFFTQQLRSPFPLPLLRLPKLGERKKRESARALIRKSPSNDAALTLNKLLMATHSLPFPTSFTPSLHIVRPKNRHNNTLTDKEFTIFARRLVFLSLLILNCIIRFLYKNYITP